MYVAPTLWNALDLDIRLLSKKSQDTSLSEVRNGGFKSIEDIMVDANGSSTWCGKYAVVRWEVNMWLAVNDGRL